MYLAQCMPQSVYLGTAALTVAAAALSGLRKQGLLHSETGSSMWRTWIDLLGLVGVSALAQVGTGAVLDSASTGGRSKFYLQSVLCRPLAIPLRGWRARCRGLWVWEQLQPCWSW